MSCWFGHMRVNDVQGRVKVYVCSVARYHMYICCVYVLACRHCFAVKTFSLSGPVRVFRRSFIRFLCCVLLDVIRALQLPFSSFVAFRDHLSSSSTMKGSMAAGVFCPLFPRSTQRSALPLPPSCRLSLLRRRLSAPEDDVLFFAVKKIVLFID